MTELLLPNLRGGAEDSGEPAAPSALGVVVCVNYESARDTEAFIASIRSQELGDRIDIVLVDNSPSLDPGLERLAREDARLWLRRPETNPGYFGGAHAGLTWYRQTYGLPGWVIVSNVDILLDGESFFESLLALDVAPDVGVIAPSTLVAGTGREQNPFLRSRPPRRTLVLKRELLRWPLTYRLWLLANRWRGRSNGSSPDAPPGNVYAAHGAFLVLHRRYFDQGGTLDFPLALYGEEVFVAETSRRLGLKIRFEPRLVVHHNEHVSTSRLGRRRSFLFKCTSFIIERYYS